MARNTRTKAQRVLDRAEIVKLMRRGWTSAAIAEHMGIDAGKIQQDWKIVVSQVQLNQSEEAKEAVAIKLEEYAEIKREAWDAWERSKVNNRKVVTEESPDKEDNSPSDEDEGDEEEEGNNRRKPKKLPDKKTIKLRKRTKTVEGRLPVGEYLKIILDCIKQERELRGINPSKQVSITGQINWDLLAGELEDDKPQIVETKLAHMLGYEEGELVELEPGTIDVNNFQFPDDPIPIQGLPPNERNNS